MRSSPFALVALCAALLGPALARREPRLGWAACAGALLFFVLPFGYESSVAQLATGASLRFAAPAIAVGAVILAPPARDTSPWLRRRAARFDVFGIWYVLSIFWNDGSTHAALPIAALAVAIVAAARFRRARWLEALAVGLAVIAATHLAARHPVDYYTDALRVDGTSSGLYRWIAAKRPAAVGGWGLRLGIVNVLSPTTRTLDMLDTAPCAQARQNGVLLVAVAQSDRAPDANAQRLRSARVCGQTLYEDPIAVVAQP